MLLEAMLMMAADPAAIRCRGVSLAEATAEYAGRLQAMDIGGIAAFYGTDGQMALRGGGAATGSTAVATVLMGSANFRITTDTMTIADTRAVPQGWRVEGRYTQTGTVAGGRGYAVHGAYTINWRCNPKAGWRIRRMDAKDD